MVLASLKLEKEITQVTNNHAVNNQKNNIGKTEKIEIDEEKVPFKEGNDEMEEKKDFIKAIQICNEEIVHEKKDNKLDKQDSSSSKCKLPFEEEDIKHSKEKWTI